MKITFITTGGTIDKNYAGYAGTYNFEISNPTVENILQKVNPNFDYEIISILKKDSLDMTDEDRLKNFETCKKCASDKIIVTHGTDTMVNTAKVLSQIKDKTIILFGSAKPQIFSNTDADFNLGVAVGALNILKNGVYYNHEWQSL